MAGCCEGMARFLLFVFNFIFVITGLALIGLGAYVQIQAKEYLDFLGNAYVNTPVVFMIVGGVIFVIAFFGCCGAWKKSECMIYTYAVFLLIVLLAEIGAGIAAYVMHGDLETEMETNMKNGMTHYNTTGYEGVTNTWDILQGKLKCCGVKAPEDWADKGKNMPDSCCEKDVKGCGMKPDVPKWQKGCLNDLKDEFIANIDKIGGTALGIAVIQLIGVILACCIGKRIHDTGEFV